jgi:hypothetical protein
LLAERLSCAVLRAAAHPSHANADQHTPPIDRDVRRHPLMEGMHVPRGGPAGRALHRAATGARANHDHLSDVLDIIDRQRRQPRKHRPDQEFHIDHGRS